VIPIHEDLLKKGYLIWVPGSEALPVVRVVAGVPACPAPCRSGPAALPDLRRTSCGTGKASLSSAAQTTSARRALHCRNRLASNPAKTLTKYSVRINEAERSLNLKVFHCQWYLLVMEVKTVRRIL
jgi:hypothetical protein